MEQWERFSIDQGCAQLSDSTCFGLKVTLKATLEISSYLIETHGFKYLMTARLNQDSLEVSSEF